ncbi:MAG TPA: DUF6587 family protein, partial [Tahibacter sp.]|nr:DUF6587 family protein [Tahibacter sp.]
MNAGLAIQYVVIGLAVAASAAYVVRKYWPRRNAAAGCGSGGDGCSTCGACATPAPADEAMPL